MGILASLPGDTLFALGLSVQALCGLGVFLIAGWRALVLFVVLVPLYWLIPFGLASAHMLAALDGVLFLPAAFLVVVFIRKVRSIEEGNGK
ncbi:hypothetical protein [Ramlibacter sp. WS9]|uniref:hypothetical protein n=1 Tax=Ramlibacter sp. WS9 TaxID=1882741 RepID=UPI001142403B|nr:hypothetical protein [Ramlibacter sp. WS9]ROZ75397.1 hypothetical protein EEB15_15700 [Ramlibacter sp. WS9]